MAWICNHSNFVTKVVLHIEKDVVVTEEAPCWKRSYNKALSTVNHFDFPIVNEIKVIKTTSWFIDVFTLVMDPHVQFSKYFAYEDFIGEYLLRVVIEEEGEFLFLLEEYCTH